MLEGLCLQAAATAFTQGKIVKNTAFCSEKYLKTVNAEVHRRLFFLQLSLISLPFPLFYFLFFYFAFVFGFALLLLFF